MVDNANHDKRLSISENLDCKENSFEEELLQQITSKLAKKMDGLKDIFDKMEQKINMIDTISTHNNRE